MAADRGDHKPAKELLMHTGTIEPLGADGRAQGPLVLVYVGDGKPPIGPEFFPQWRCDRRRSDGVAADVPGEREWGVAAGDER